MRVEERQAKIPESLSADPDLTVHELAARLFCQRCAAPTADRGTGRQKVKRENRQGRMPCRF